MRELFEDSDLIPLGICDCRNLYINRKVDKKHTSSFIMSEGDDLDILADIKALDEALALSAREKLQQCVSNQQSDASSDAEDSNNDDYVDYLCTNRHIDKSLNAYEINTKLITGLTITKRKLTALLEECEQKIKLLDEKITKAKDESSYGNKLTIINAGMPYFKDKNYFSAPKNYDTKLKEARGELFLPSLSRTCRWSGKDRETLLNAINNQAIESVLCGEFNEEIDDKTKLVIPRNFNEMVGAVGEREFDWYKISVMDFDNRHTPVECRAMWNVYLHPEFRKDEWTSAEDGKLLKYTREFKCQDWDAITRKLGTNRSAYQCFIRYNTIKKVPSSGRPWTKQEDRHIAKVIEAVRVGDYIPWFELANHMRHRTKQQIYVRWMYRKSPHLRKGRFTVVETSTLMKAVQRYGTDFPKISSAVMPHRTSIQLQQRYRTVLEKCSNLWTVNDDVALINLYIKYNNNWSKIATYFSDKSRTQVRHRYTALLKYVQKGVSLESIPRPYIMFPGRKISINNKNKMSSSMLKMHNKLAYRKYLQDRQQHTVQIYDIQLRLYETFCLPLSIKCNNSEELDDTEQLARDTKKLYNTLTLLNANLDMPDLNFLNYVQLNNREKQYLVSLKEHMNMVNNRLQNDELIEKFRTQMFGQSEDSENDFFIPPLPFEGYVRTLKTKKSKIKNTSIDYDLGFNEKFLIDIPTHFSVTNSILPFLSVEEEMQFYKFGQFLISDYHDCDQQDVDLYKSLKCIFSFAKESPSSKASPECSRPNASLEDHEQSNKSKETTSVNEDAEKGDTSNVILPNQATLLGWKNLLLWKLLYDYQNESGQQYEFGNEQNPEPTTTNSRPAQTESAEYQLLRTRLLQLFKFPISLSNTILQVQGPETIFVAKSTTKPTVVPTVSTVSRKRKHNSAKSVLSLQLNKNDSLDVPADSDSQLNSGVTTQKNFEVCSCRTTRKKYKITK
ncbi:uncharacterized protein Pbp95 [Temnothorax longispinosus]|uniref:snRNA-activating protein complex subunit 4 n=1 Tax=Temnothorax longispinosus TaxID=300112 RepID=A0A4S2JAE8_9HYME|nr:snRNA-activating protein complex subunit 4 [Temnothorax longispinosus]